jgi:nucleoside-diphosphate-sugar epimerase
VGRAIDPRVAAPYEPPVRILLAGATGAIGVPLLTLLAAQGYEVTALTRSEERARAIHGPRVHARVCDVYDEEALVRAAVESKPDAVLHELTALPKRLRPRRVNEDTAATNRLRTEGTRNLLRAAAAAGAKRFIAQSIAFVTKPEGPAVLDESAPLYLDAAPSMRAPIAAVAELERLVTTAPGICGTVLRYGFFYGPCTSYATDGAVTEDIARGRIPIVGDGGGLWSFVHVDDAARATALALERGEGIYNVTDDDPAPSREWIAHLAARFGKKPMRVPGWVGRIAAGPYGVFLMTELRGANNGKARGELGWAPSRAWRTSLGC